MLQQVATGSAAALLVGVADHAGLLVTGARRHGEGEHGMVVGPLTQTLLRHAGCRWLSSPLIELTAQPPAGNTEPTAPPKPSRSITGRKRS